MSQSMSKAEAKAGKKKNEALETIVVIIEALAIALIFRTFLYQPFSITASMQQTLMIGDYFIANKWTWGFGKYSFPIAVPFNGRIFGSEPKRGDVAVFRNEITNEDYIKRVIGMPGDRIQMKKGSPLHQRYHGRAHADRYRAGYRQLHDHGAGDCLHRDAAQWRDAHHPGNLRRPTARQPGRVRRAVRPLFHDGRQRDRSADSRVLNQVGYVPLDNFIGKAEARFFSIKNNLPPWQLWELTANVRWDRMFQSVN